MNILRYLALFILLYSANQLCAINDIRYFTGDFEKAKLQAAEEGKLLLLDFYASWCAPCKWMDETTFSDPEVKEVISQKYVPLKINIDDFDGYALKQYYDVKVLPTIVIFNQDGKIIDRVEKTLSPSKMVNILNENLKNNKPAKRHLNMDPYATVKKEVKETTKSAEIAKSSDERQVYKLQLGVFNSYKETLKMYNKISAILEEPIIILHDYKGDSIIYRVLIGQFKDTNQAYFYKTELKEKHNIDSNLHL